MLADWICADATRAPLTCSGGRPFCARAWLVRSTTCCSSGDIVAGGVLGGDGAGGWRRHGRRTRHRDCADAADRHRNAQGMPGVGHIDGFAHDSHDLDLADLGGRELPNPRPRRPSAPDRGRFPWARCPPGSGPRATIPEPTAPHAKGVAETPPERSRRGSRRSTVGANPACPGTTLHRVPFACPAAPGEVESIGIDPGRRDRLPFRNPAQGTSASGWEPGPLVGQRRASVDQITRKRSRGADSLQPGSSRNR